jgi:hypothetical protein
VLVYSLVTLPFGQVVQRVLKTYSFRKRLKELENAPPQSSRKTEGA